MKIAIAQRNYTIGDFNGNKSKIIGSISHARQKGADLVVFAEYAISGTPCHDLLHNPTFLDECEQTLRDIAEFCHDIAVIVGLPTLDQNKVISCAAFIQDKTVKKYIGKNNVVSRPEKTYVCNSKGVEFIKVGDTNIAVVVGDDIRLERAFGELADIIIAIASNPYARGQIEYRYNWLKNMAFTVGKPLVYANHEGGQYNYIYDGSSLSMDRQGEPIALLKSFEEDFALVDTQCTDKMEIPDQDRTRNIYNAIKLGLKDFFNKTGFSKACLGMSGGIDSAVVLAMVAEVLDPKDIKVLMLPSQFSSDHSVKDAVEMAERLGVAYEIIPIEPAFRAVVESLKPILGGTDFDVTEENIQSRLRGLMLMALSNKQGYILLNTSNKSEAAVGYGTLYGDMTGSIGPIGDLYKVEVYELARYINREKEIIPENIIRKEPSAELRPDQKDSDSLPPYEIMDAILTRMIEYKEPLDEIIGAGFDDKTVRRIADMVKRAEFKRRQSPPPLLLSQGPLMNHYILPLINKFGV